MYPMFSADLPIIISWWAVLFVIGAAAFPLTKRLFASWWDQGYLLSKAVGLAVVTYGVWLLGSLHLLPFRLETIVLVVGVLFAVGLIKRVDNLRNISWKKIIALELFFVIALMCWSFVKAHEPDIHGLEKFMDYGFSESILHSDYFPPPDMWYAGGTINYYYFGHMMQALLSKFSGIDLGYGYNLMLATLFALCFTMSFGIGYQLFHFVTKRSKVWAVVAGVLTAFLVSLSGNMQTIYAFTQGYSGDNPPAFWNILWSPAEFITKLPEGMAKYWYANATRFIPFTIHEFPSYSFVVSDNHGHVLGIPFTLLMIASLISWFGMKGQNKRSALPYLLFGGLTGVLFMTNALDGPIYFGLFSILLLLQSEGLQEKAKQWGIALGAFLFSALPFLLTFKSFANGLALNCPPEFLANSQIGPFIFETVDKCQRSPLWMMWLLWGFFWFCGAVFVLKHRKQLSDFNKTLTIIFFYCVGLIVFAEIFYFKDIYPAHFRSNTMFKLGYQSFMMSSLLAGLIIIQMLADKAKTSKRVFFLLLAPQLFLVSIFPYFSVRSYFGQLQTYKGLYGLSWLQTQYPDDYKAMLWLRQTTLTQRVYTMPDRLGYLLHPSFFTSHIPSTPVIVEADGDSYTDFGRMSAFAGVPTIVGWGVHEWLWRGTYDVVAPRKDEVQKIYEASDLATVRHLLTKYNVTYAIVGTLERQKFKLLNEQHFLELGHVAFRSGETVIYALDKI